MLYKEIEVKTWYLTKYSEDTEGVNLKWDISFADVYEVLKSNPDSLYSFIGVGDSLIRERIFEKIAELYGIEYDEVYNMYLK